MDMKPSIMSYKNGTSGDDDGFLFTIAVHVVQNKTKLNLTEGCSYVTLGAIYSHLGFMAVMDNNRYLQR